MTLHVTVTHMSQKDVEDSRTIILYYISIAYNIHILYVIIHLDINIFLFLLLMMKRHVTVVT